MYSGVCFRSRVYYYSTRPPLKEKKKKKKKIQCCSAFEYVSSLFLSFYLCVCVCVSHPSDRIIDLEPFFVVSLCVF